jgi:hypothetical protein
VAFERSCLKIVRRVEQWIRRCTQSVFIFDADLIQKKCVTGCIGGGLLEDHSSYTMGIKRGYGIGDRPAERDAHANPLFGRNVPGKLTHPKA